MSRSGRKFQGQRGPAAYPGPAWNARPWPGVSELSWAGRLHHLALRRRRLIAALFLCAAAAIAVEQLTPASAPTTAVLVASRDLPAGHPLTATDYRIQALDPAMVPDGLLDPHNPAPRDGRLSGPVRRGEVLTDAALLGSGLLTGAPAGSQAVPLRLSDPSTLPLLRQGQLVTVVLSSAEGLEAAATTVVLAEKVPVLWTPGDADAGEGLLPGASDTEPVVVVAASPEQAVQLAGAINRGKVFLILLN
ncbi:RcpC/CpaB family pilus assembly protein [Specibacter sp. NPDC057265]|uniref:RcpC/CpaB family pilus assembly protein n=1 Tax=Specibacter sp. NPDC057265 TaxID=3346075 RepID=UPI003640B48A